MTDVGIALLQRVCVLQRTSDLLSLHEKACLISSAATPEALSDVLCYLTASCTFVRVVAAQWLERAQCSARSYGQFKQRAHLASSAAPLRTVRARRPARSHEFSNDELRGR